MPRIVIISIIILTALIWFAFKTKQAGQQTLSTALFTAATVYALILLGGFSGILGN